MRMRQKQIVLGIAAGLIFSGLGCQREKVDHLEVDNLKVGTLQTGSLDVDNLKVKKGVKAALVPITIVATDPQHCTANTPWEYAFTDGSFPTNNDKVVFQSSGVGAAQTYKIVFLNNNTPLDTATIDKVTTAGSQHQVQIDPRNICSASGGMCAYPYQIFNITNGDNGPQCNNQPTGPPFGTGTDGLIIKCGNNC